MLMKATNNQAATYVTEYLRCKSDFNYYAMNYVLIELPGKDVKINPYQKQKDLIDEITRSHHVIVLKSRQIGISTIVQAYSSWLMVFYDNVVVGIISKDGKEATDFARTIRGIIEKLPSWMKPKGGGKIGGENENFDKKTEQSFILTNGSKCFATTVNPMAPNKVLRGKAVTFLIIDEAAFISNLDSAWTALVPSLSTSQKHAISAGVPFGTIILSTPNGTLGQGQWFYTKYQNAVSSTGIFRPFTIHWKQIPELANDPGWYKTQCEMFDHDPRKIEQELEMKFLTASGTFFEDKVCSMLQENTKDCSPIEISRLFDGEIWVFEKPQPGKHYLIGVDTAPEHGHDKSAITIWDYETLDQVWEYQVKCKVMDFIKVVKFAIAQYPGTIIIENNSYGNQVMESINESEYSFYMYKEKRGENRILPGLSTNAKTRPLMIDAMYSYVSQFPQMVKSKRLALELIGLTKKPSGKVEAVSGSTDDLALTLAFAMYVRKYDPPMMIEVNKVAASAFDMIVGMNYNEKTKFADDNDEFESHDREWQENKIRDMELTLLNKVRNEVFTMDKAYINTFDIYKQ